MACGLIRASFVPEEEIQNLRSLLRARKQLTREQASHVLRLQKTLEEANIKLDSVITDILGASGRRMIEAMISGIRNPQALAKLADHRIKATPKALYDALHGRLTDHHRFMLRLYLGQYDALASSIEQIDQQVEATITHMDAEVRAGQATFRSLIALVSTIPGIRTLSGATILSEIGTDPGLRRGRLWVDFRRQDISSPGPAYVPARTRAPASESPPASGRVLLG